MKNYEKNNMNIKNFCTNIIINKYQNRPSAEYINITTSSISHHGAPNGRVVVTLKVNIKPSQIPKILI
jgi:hypothetical protein